MVQYPAVWYGGLTIGSCVGWVILQQTANSFYFPAYYNYSGLAVGNLNISVSSHVLSGFSQDSLLTNLQSVVGAIVGCFYGGTGSDWVVAWVTKRRGGYFEPEYRLWAVIPICPFVPLGLMLWGCGLAFQLNPMVAVVGSGITYGVLCAISAVALTYLVDCYRPLAGETLTISTAIKNIFGFAISFAVIPWIEANGFVKVRDKFWYDFTFRANFSSLGRGV